MKEIKKIVYFESVQRIAAMRLNNPLKSLPIFFHNTHFLSTHAPFINNKDVQWRLLLQAKMCVGIFIQLYMGKKNQFQTKYKIVFAIKKNQDFLMRFFFFLFMLGRPFPQIQCSGYHTKKIIICHYEITQIYINQLVRR